MEGRAGAPTLAPAPSRALLGYLREHRGALVIVVALSILGAGLNLAQPLLVNRLIDSVGTGRPLAQLIWVLIVLVVGAGVVGAVQQFLLERTAEGVVLTARRRLIAALLHLPVRVYDTRRAGDLVSRVGSDTTMVRAALTGGLVDALGGALVFAGSLIAMLLLDAVLLGITLAVVAVAMVSVVLASAQIQTLTQSAQEALGRLGAGVERAVSAIRTIRASGATDREIARLNDEASAAYGYGVRVAGVEAVLWPISGLAVQGSFLAVLGVGGYRVAAGALTVADLVTFILFLFMMIMPLGQFFSAITTVRSALGALARIHEVLDLPREDDGDPPVIAGVPGRAGTSSEEPPPPAEGAEVVFDHVTFAFRPGHRVLTDVTLTAPRGSTTAIVGPSGAGKSTLLALVERFYDPDRGAIRLDGTDIRVMPRAVLRAQIGYVEQDAPVLAGTIRENLVLANPTADDDQCRTVLAAVNLLERIAAHPDGLDATVGDDGAGLSGGERQRLAIARALLVDAPLLLLDEPTASLDSRNEQALHQAIRSASTGRTVLIVAHRLATVAAADQIVVLDRGRLTATGTHAELLETSALYRELAHHQLLA
ncbi:ABC transporter ATP-binding protein [Arthrobacter sp. AOP36-A1-22]|uniref:ABC transporter ATP-binding protein n=1 Tax=Micrococcales TaxID=85006 RepID=UPI000C58BAA7|nr:ABC transporter ATP-binding protein [Brevibacterium sp. 239c]MDN5893033.1 ABC transporter ATP-binding protein/permease [Nocardioides sp.]SMX69563.1 ATP-binding cassette, subfamily B [Brevibacterium sp. 239c]